MTGNGVLPGTEDVGNLILLDVYQLFGYSMDFGKRLRGDVRRTIGPTRHQTVDRYLRRLSDFVYWHLSVSKPESNIFTAPVMR